MLRTLRGEMMAAAIGASRVRKRVRRAVVMRSDPAIAEMAGRNLSAAKIAPADMTAHMAIKMRTAIMRDPGVTHMPASDADMSTAKVRAAGMSTTVSATSKCIASG